MRRYGLLYGAAVLRPFAEQLAAALDVESGQTVCDLLCDGGELSRALAAKVGHAGTVFAADIDTVPADSVSALKEIVVATVMRHGVVPLADGVCDAVGVLFTTGFAAGVPSEARRLCRARSHVLAAVWDPEDPPAHEQVLRAALQTAARHESEYLRTVLAVPRESIGTGVTAHDVVRFDGFAHYWAAMVSQRPLMTELHVIPEAALREAQEMIRTALAQFAAADGTLRIPVSAKFVPL
jgi:hypothetical protein